MQSAVASMGAGVPQGKGAIVYTARSYIGRLITLNHKVLYCSETHPNSPPIEQVYWPENAFLPLHHRNFVGREFKSQRRARRRQKINYRNFRIGDGLLLQRLLNPRRRTIRVSGDFASSTSLRERSNCPS